MYLADIRDNSGREITGLDGRIASLENVPQTLAVLVPVHLKFHVSAGSRFILRALGATEKGKKREQPASPLRTFFAVVLESP